MWTRRELKERAKDTLRTSYWKAFLVSLLMLVISGGVPSCNFQNAMGGRPEHGGGSNSLLPGLNQDWNAAADHTAFIAVMIIAVIIGILVGLAVFAFRIFLGFPLEVGVRQYFKQAALTEVNMNYLGYAFARGKYGAIVKAMLLKAVFNFLWYLLFIIPGIIKAYSYSMVPYILADNPQIGAKRAVTLSREMTRGHKWNMFVLDLSFLGWYLLGALALVVGLLFVEPYVNSTKAELYLVLRRHAVNTGMSGRSELNMADTD